MIAFRYASLAMAATLVLHAGPACSQSAGPGQAAAKPSLSEARKGSATTIVRSGEREPPMPAPPKGIFQLVRFDAPVGKLGAYLTPDPGDGKRHPAIIWLTGGDTNSVGEMWSP